MEYILIVLLLIVALLVMTVKAANAIFWIVLVVTIIAWLLSLLFDVTKNFKAFKTCYDVFFMGRMVLVALGVILLLIRWLLPWMLE